MERTSEPWVPEPPPQGPRFEVREVPTCPTCHGLARREIGALTAEGPSFGPWRCDIHGEVTPVFERVEVSAGYDDA
jgi:hypothetical protein